METKAVIRFSTAYEKLDAVEKDIEEVKQHLKDEDHIKILDRALRMIDSHHGLLLYAKENHGVDLEKILDHYYDESKGVTREQEHQMENIK